MFAGSCFHFRPALTICMLAALAVLISLGNWQLQRLQWKRDLIAKVETRLNAAPIPFEDAAARARAGEDMEYAPVSLRGRNRGGREEKVFGSYEGRAGYFVFTPFETASGAAVYVNLGFVPQTEPAWACLCEREGGRPTEIGGLFRYAERSAPPASWFRPKTETAGGLWFMRDPALFAAAAKVPASPYYIDSFAVDGVSWPKGGTTRLTFANRHLEYALTWFGLGAALVAVWFAFSLQKSEKSNNFKK